MAKTKGSTLKQTAVSEIAGQLEEIRRDLRELAPKASPTVEKLFEWYLPKLKRLESAALVESRFRRHILPHVGHLNSQTLMPAAIERMIATLSKTLGPEMLNKVRIDLRALIRDASANGLWSAGNPADAVKARKMPGKTYNTLSAEEAAEVLEFVRPDWRNLFALAVYLGPRKGEIFAVRTDEVDIERRTISFLRSHGRATTKTGRVREHLPLPDELVPYVADALARARGGTLLFPSPNGTRLNPTHNATRILATAMKTAGIVDGWRAICRRKGCGFAEVLKDPLEKRCPQCNMRLWLSGAPRPIRFYDLRHTAATLHRQAGCDPAVIRVVLGHADRDVTSDVYTHLSDEYMRKEINKMSLAKKANTGEQKQKRRKGFEPSTPSLGSTAASKAKKSRTSLASSVELVDLLNINEVAEILRVTPKSIYIHVEKGTLPHVRFGSLIRISRKALTAWIERGGERRRNE